MQSKTSASLDGQLKEARSKLSLAETLVQQLSGGSDDAKEREEAYKAMKTQNEQLVAQLNEVFYTLGVAFFSHLFFEWLTDDSVAAESISGARRDEEEVPGSVQSVRGSSSSVGKSG